MDKIIRLVLSLFSVYLYKYMNNFLVEFSVSKRTEASLKQFNMNAHDYALSNADSSFWMNFHIPFIILVLIVCVIWWKYIKEYISSFAVIALTVCSFSYSAPSYAYFQVHDNEERIPILPNQTAFLISDDGDKNHQARMMSEEYLKNKEVPSQSVKIEHKLLHRAGFSQDYYIPAERLILVTRTTFSRAWVSDKTRGTSSKNEGMPCQSSDSLNITTGVAISTRIDPENAAKYLYNFGVVSPAQIDYTNEEEIYKSTYDARSLTDVMDNAVRDQVHTLVCNEVSNKTFDQANAQMPQEMEEIQKSVKAYLDSVGITLISIGWADTFQFDESIQKAINDRYIAKTVSPYLHELQTLADIKVREGMGYGLAEHGVPQTLAVDKDMAMSMFSPMFKAGTLPASSK